MADSFPRAPWFSRAIALLAVGGLLSIGAASPCFAQTTEQLPVDSLAAPPSPVIDEHEGGGVSTGADGVWWPVPQLTGAAHAFAPGHAFGSIQPPTLHADIGERHGHTMIFDPVRQRFLLFGGTRLPNSVFYNDLWERPLHGTGEWTPVATTGGPPSGRWGHVAVYDPIGDRMIVFGGRDAGYRDDTWELALSGTPAWQPIASAWPPPSARAWHAAVFDAAHNRLIVHGGRNAGGFLGDVWYLDFDPLPPHWYPVTPSGSPPATRYGHVAVLDAAHARVVVYGGIGTEYYSDVWTLSLGSSPAWTRRSTAFTPGRRDAASGVIDPTGNRMLIFGGRQPSSVHDQNLWAFDLTSFAWSLLSPTGTIPAIRRHAAMAIDPASRRAILQGGVEGALRTLSDTWALTLSAGPAWTKLFPQTPEPPQIASFTPQSGPPGTQVTIMGGGFTQASAVAFNANASSYVVISDNEIRATAPYVVTNGKIRVTTPFGTAFSVGNFNVTPPPGPDIASFSPSGGAAGTLVTILGSHFEGASAVSFNGTPASFTLVSGGEIRATVPLQATTGRISVTTTLGGTRLSSVDFTVPTPPPPTITSFSPASGVTGTVVTLFGSDLGTTSSVKFNLISAAFTVIAAGEVRATVPGSATTGRIEITTAGGSATSASDFTVTPAPPPPAISSFSPASGPVGTFVAIVGSGFAGTSSVAINATSANFTVVSSTEISAVIPSGAMTGMFRVTTPNGVATSATDFVVTPLPPPTPANAGAHRYGAGGDFDPNRGRHLVVAGAFHDPPSFGPTYLNDVHGLRIGVDSTWVRIDYSGTPMSARLGPSAVYDPVRDRLLIFGGHDGNFLNDLYELRFSPSPMLQPLAVPGAPGPRDFHAAVYDAMRDRMLVFGGNLGGTALGDLWELTLGGTPAWRLIDAGNASTPKRMVAGMVLDPFADRLVLFGGWAAPGSRNDLWQYPLSGPGGWSAVAAGGSPPGPRHSFSFRLDPLRQRAILHSGKHEESQSLYAGTWELSLSGSPQWRLLNTGGGSPIPRLGHLAVVDAIHDRMLLSGGHSSGYTLTDVWRLQWAADQPTPVALSFRVDAVTEHAVELSGHVGLVEDAPCRLERSPDGAEWSLRSEIHADASGSIHFVDREVAPGQVVHYRLAARVAGEWIRSEEIRVQVPRADDFALLGFSPNPASGDVRVAFRLAGGGPATVELIDVSGRRVATRRIETFTPGAATVGFAGERLSPGLYFVRLTQGERSAVRRGIIAP